MEEQRKGELSLSTIWFVFKRCWWLMLIAMTVVAVISGVVAVQMHQSEYTASAKIWTFRSRDPIVGGDSDKKTEGDIIYENLIIDYYNAQVSKELAPDYMEILKADIVLQNTVDAYAASYGADKAPTTKQLAKMIKIKNVDQTRLLMIQVTADTPEKARDIANIWGNEFKNYVNTQLMNDQDYIQIADPAILPETESNPISIVNLAILGIFAAMIVYAIYLILFITDDKINTPEDVERYLGLNLLGSIPSAKKDVEISWRVYSAEEIEQKNN